MGDNLPALIDGIVRDLAEVRTIEGVLEIRDRAEALLAYAKKHKAAVDMQTGAVQVVLLCERRIGVELEKIPRNRGGGRHPSVMPTGGSQGPPSANPTAVPYEDPPSLADLGFRRDQVQEYVALARIDPMEIERAAEEARASGRALTKAAVKRQAAGSRAARMTAGGRKPGSSPQMGGRKGGSSKPPTNVVPEQVVHLKRWIASFDLLASEFPGGAGLRALCERSGYRIDEGRLDEIMSFIGGLRAAGKAGRAA